MNKNNKILVIGEFCLDRHVYGSSSSAPDGPFFVFKENYKTENWGCAGNVVKNLESLAPEYEIEFITNFEPIIKTRYVDIKSNYTLLRIDENDSVLPIQEREITELINRDDFAAFNGVVISDYNKNLITKNDIYRISKRCFDLDIPLFLDSKKIFGEWSKLVTFIKINNLEWQENLKNNVNPVEFCANLIISTGEKGAIYKNEIFPAKKVDVIDLSGAGDSFHSALVIKYLQTKDIRVAIEYGNRVAAVAVSHKGVVVVKPELVV